MDQHSGRSTKLKQHNEDEPAPPKVLALINARDLRERISSALRGAATVVFVRDGSELLSAMRHQLPTLLLIDRVDGHGRSITPTVQRVRLRFPNTHIVAISGLTARDARSLVELAQAGVTAVLLPDIDNVAETLQAEVARAETRRHCEFITGAFAATWTSEALTIFQHCLEHSSRRISTDALAFELGISRKTLAKRLVTAGLPAPSNLIGWVRMLTAFWRIEHLGCSVEEAARACGFDSATGLRNMLRRHTGLTLRQVSENGGLSYLIGKLTHSPATIAMPRQATGSGRDRRRRA